MGKNLFNLCSRAGIAPVNFSKIHGRMPVGGKFTGKGSKLLRSLLHISGGVLRVCKS